MNVTVKDLEDAFAFSKFKDKDFEEHIRSSIPNYEGMRRLIPKVIGNFIHKGENVYDIGCSSGDFLKELWVSTPTDLKMSFVGYDIAGNLLPTEYIGKNINFFERDVTEDTLTLFNTSLICSLFTLQFIPLDKRVDLIHKVYNSLSKRGCFLVCEKIFSEYGQTEDIFTFANYEMKSKNGFSAKEILDKQKDLQNIMQPLTQSENEKMFREAGFQVVEVFFKSLNFIGWILIK